MNKIKLGFLILFIVATLVSVFSSSVQQHLCKTSGESQFNFYSLKSNCSTELLVEKQCLTSKTSCCSKKSTPSKVKKSGVEFSSNCCEEINYFFPINFHVSETDSYSELVPLYRNISPISTIQFIAENKTYPVSINAPPPIHYSVLERLAVLQIYRL